MIFPAEVIYTGSAVACAAVATVFDVRSRRIPNLLTGPAILFGLLLHLSLGGFVQLGWSLLAGLIAGFLFLLFFLAGGMGAGDVKLITAVCCIAGIGSIKEVLASTVLIGGVFAIGLAVTRGRLRELVTNVSVLVAHHRQNGLTEHPDLNVRNRDTLRLPYALPIACGCIITFCINFWGAGPR